MDDQNYDPKTEETDIGKFLRLRDAVELFLRGTESCEKCKSLEFDEWALDELRRVLREVKG